MVVRFLELFSFFGIADVPSSVSVPIIRRSNAVFAEVRGVGIYVPSIHWPSPTRRFVLDVRRFCGDDEIYSYRRGNSANVFFRFACFRTLLCFVNRRTVCAVRYDQICQRLVFVAQFPIVVRIRSFRVREVLFGLG